MARNVDGGNSGVAEGQVGGELASTFFVGAVRDSDEEVVFGFADVAAIDGARRIDRKCAEIEALNNGPDGCYLTRAARCSGASEDSGVRREDGCVFDEGRVGVANIGIEDGEFKAALAQGIAITRVLVQDFVEVRNAQIDSSKAVGKVTAGNTNNGVGEQAHGSE